MSGNCWIDSNVNYRLILKGKLIALLPAGLAPMQPSDFGLLTAVNVSLPEYGGCAAWSENNFVANYTVPAVPMIPLKNATVLSPTAHTNNGSLSEMGIIGISVASGQQLIPIMALCLKWVLLVSVLPLVL